MSEKVPTLKEVTKLRKCLNEERSKKYAQEIKKKIQKAVSNEEDQTLLYECKSSETSKIETICKILKESGWIPVKKRDYNKNTVKIYWNYKKNKNTPKKEVPVSNYVFYKITSYYGYKTPLYYEEYKIYLKNNRSFKYFRFIDY